MSAFYLLIHKIYSGSTHSELIELIVITSSETKNTEFDSSDLVNLEFRLKLRVC